MQVPKNASEMKRFIGLSNGFCKYIKDFAVLIKPLNKLSQKSVPYVWSETAQNAFDEIKRKVADVTKLFHVTWKSPLVLRTDASEMGVGAVLLQIVDGAIEQPIVFLSQAFSDVASRWSTIEQEAYGVFWSVVKLDSYLLGQFFFLETDHRNLVYMEESVTPKVIRWRLRLQEYDYQIIHIAGRDNVIADALSRCYLIKDISFVNRFQQCFESVHNSVIGHHGFVRTKLLLRNRGLLFEPISDCDNEIKRLISCCAWCQKYYEGKPSEEDIRSTCSYEPFEQVAIDTMGPMTEDVDGNKYILVVIDCFSRFVELIPCKDVTAVSAAKALLQVVGRYGCIQRIQSDHGSQYDNELIDNLCNWFEIRHRYSLPYRPQANGIVERVNKEIMRHLRYYLADKLIFDKWGMCLPLIQRIVNSSVSGVTNESPMRIIYGDMITSNRGLFDLKKNYDNISHNAEFGLYINELNDCIKRVTMIASNYQKDVIKKRLAKSPEFPTVFEIGDYVLVSYPGDGKPPSKLNMRWKGPFQVVSRDSQKYVVRDLMTEVDNTYFVNRMKLFTMDDVETDLKHLAISDVQEYVIDNIINFRKYSPTSINSCEFLVHWFGFSSDNDTWEPYVNLKNTVQLNDFMKLHIDKFKKWLIKGVDYF
jgi:transposase InsO family protein